MNNPNQPEKLSPSVGLLSVAGRSETEQYICALLGDALKQELPPPLFIAVLVDRIIENKIPHIAYTGPGKVYEHSASSQS